MVAAVDRVGAFDATECILVFTEQFLCLFNKAKNSGCGFLIFFFAGNLMEASPVDAELAIARQAGPVNCRLPVLVEATREPPVSRERGQHGITDDSGG